MKTDRPLRFISPLNDYLLQYLCLRVYTTEEADGTWTGVGLLVGVYPGSGYDGVDWKYLWGSRGTEVGVNWREGVQFIWR